MLEAFDNAATQAVYAPDEFRRHATNLASLSPEEIELIGRFYKTYKAIMTSTNGQGAEGSVIWTSLKTNVKGSPIFPTDTHVTMYAAALLRTGWVIPLSVFGGMAFGLTPLFHDMARLNDWDEALKAEPLSETAE
jgi:hypothetical protein